MFVPIAENGEGDPVKICRLRLRERIRPGTPAYRDVFRRMGSRLRTRRSAVARANLSRRGVRRYFRAAILEPALRRARRVRGCESACNFLVGRSHAISGTQRLRSAPGCAGSHAPGQSNRRGRGSSGGAATSGRCWKRTRNSKSHFYWARRKRVDAARALVTRYQNRDAVRAALESTQHWWDSRLDTLQVHTPLLSIDLMLNRWLVYQALSCRFWGRSGLQQSSGAFGYRDQLQDCLAFLYGAPELTRAHILTCASSPIFRRRRATLVARRNRPRRSHAMLG